MSDDNDDEQPETDLFGHPVQELSSTERRMIEAGAAIMQEPPDRVSFLHSIMCQVGMPRKKTSGRVFERANGGASMVLEAGRLWTGQGWKEQPLPYGSRPRLVMVHISSEAVRTKSRQIEIGDSIRDFMQRIGIKGDSGGKRGSYTMFKRQMEALAACRLSLGYTGHGRMVTIDTKPITRFEAWLHPEGNQRTLWPAELELSPEFFNTLTSHAVPLDPRALGILKDSALALDLYSWLAHRLCRINSGEGIKVSWRNLREQFGQEYAVSKDFKKKFRLALRRVVAVYPDAKVEEEAGGLLLKASPPPLAKTQVLVSP